MCRKGPTKIPLGKDTPPGSMKLFYAKLKTNTCTVCEIGLFTEEEEDVGPIGFWQFHCNGVLTAFERLSCLETLVGHVMFLKGPIAAALESSEPFNIFVKA